MSYIRIDEITIKNYRSFGNKKQNIIFPRADYRRPTAIIGYNNVGKTNLMNVILHALQINYVSDDTFTLDDFHDREIENVPFMLLRRSSSKEDKIDRDKLAILDGYHRLKIFIDGNEIEGAKIISLNTLSPNYNGEPDQNFQAFGAKKYFNIFNINFHKIKEEINTKKTSWGKIRSFLGSHIQKVIESDDVILRKKSEFINDISHAVMKVKEKTELSNFVSKIKKNL
ncbi:MAG: hypothetical protein O3B87_00140 [bacterium]|nr:hypothetical protein [bacterium]